MILRGMVSALALLTLSALPPAPAGAAIVFPPDKALLQGTGSIEVLGFRAAEDAAAGELVHTAEGVVRKAAVAPGIFRVPVNLAKGVNLLVLGDQSVTIFLASAGVAPSGAVFEVPDLHAVDNSCEDCHVVGTSALELAAEKGALCANCHDEVLKGKGGTALAVLHPPAEEGDCFACHKFHGAAIKKLSPRAKRAICFECHDDFTAEQGGKAPLLHKPIAQGACTGCHNPHAAAEKKLLVAAGADLCRTCHKDPGRTPEGAEWKTPHPALDDGCGTCHLVHTAGTPRLLKTSQAALCFECHDDFLKSVEGQEIVQHPPAADGECTSCHKPHGAAEKKLLVASPAKELCLGCHDDPTKDGQGDEWAVAHPALDEGCTACHRAHVAPSPRLLAKPQADLCAGCHENKNLDSEGREWESPHTPVQQGLCALCHRAHGSAEKALLAKPTLELCQSCHKDVHPKHLKIPLNDLGQPESRKASLPAGFPVRKKDGALVCTGCHQPHGSNFGSLTGQDEMQFCYRCHKV